MRKCGLSKCILTKAVLFIIVFTLESATKVDLLAQSYFKKNFVDSTDNNLDLSNYLSTKVGIIPIPVLITEPAVGYGGGLSLVYYHPSRKKMMGFVLDSILPMDPSNSPDTSLREVIGLDNLR